MAPSNKPRTCRDILRELLDDDQAHSQQELFAACAEFSPTTVTNTLSALINERAIVRTVTVTFETAHNRRKSNG